MAGITDEGGDPGTYAGVLLRRTPLNDEIAELEALYQVINASGHSFTALIQGKSHIQKGNATLNGVVTEGWALGAQVHVTFDRVFCSERKRLAVPLASFARDVVLPTRAMRRATRIRP